MSQCLEIEGFGLKYLQFAGNLPRFEFIFVPESIGKESDNVSTRDPKNKFDA